ncbi:hypothetical protein VTJ04DRAFT_2843 [Mycothermus thermophilus]|uniref:uncharacterized protein n=1 Tax=Humicola insolens TaxID=85995 RepID=UPI0037422910
MESPVATFLRMMVWIGHQEADGRMETRTQEQDSGIRKHQEQEVDGTRGQERLGQVKWLGKSNKMFALTLLHLFTLCKPPALPVAFITAYALLCWYYTSFIPTVLYRYAPFSPTVAVALVLTVLLIYTLPFGSVLRIVDFLFS